MAQVKDLYIGENLRDLEKYYDLPDYSSKKLTMLLSSARKLFQLAERSHLDGDEEQSYIQYMKYFNLVDCIRKMPDYKEHKKQVRQTLGGNGDLKITMDKLGILNKSLKKRYQRLAEKKKATEFSSRLDNNQSRNLSNSYDGTSDDSDDPCDTSKYSLMSCEDLYRQIRTSSSLLIMDCRSKTDFQNSRLHYPWCLNVPEEHIQHGMSAGKLQDRLDNNSKPLWSSRSIKDQVVLMDWNCHEANPPANTPIATLRAILQDWDPDVTYKSPIKILQNGYEYFILMYPTLCTNPSVQAPRAKEKETDIEEIEYPNIHDITMKEDVAKDGDEPRTMQRPSVDRSSKIAALKTYEQYQKPVVDILKEQELLAEKALDNGKQLLQAEHEWQTVTDQTAKTEQEDQKNVLLKTQQELYYNILQLEYTQKDLILENNRLRQELEESRRRDNEQIADKKSPKEVQTIEETTKKIEDKIQEQQKLQEQQENEKRLRMEKQLALAREQKRHMKEPTFEDEEMSKPKIPQFDRSIKPSVKSIERVRDFSPVPGTACLSIVFHIGRSVSLSHQLYNDLSRLLLLFPHYSIYMMIVLAGLKIHLPTYNFISPFKKGRGLTGLKNLGNTCYMNSILQCLSNTQPLTEYCITDKYKNNISRANKTSGHVVEEVAALFKVLWNGNYKCVASKDLRYVVGQYQKIFRGIEQQDSHEFLTILMDWLHSDLQTLQVHKPLRENMPASERAWLEFTKARESLILRLFYGQIKSTVKCVHCSKESATYECFSNLSLELPSSSNMCGLNQCMDMYFNGERIHGWICPNCKQPREAVKKLDISKLPPILVVHFKRFYADTDSAGNSYKKKLNYVTFPLENLDITPYIAKSELRSMSPKTYQLYGVSNHYGSMESGHYTAFCKSGVFGKWFKFDDQVVSPIDTSDVVSSAAYILFYTWLPQTPPPEIN